MRYFTKHNKCLYLLKYTTNNSPPPHPAMTRLLHSTVCPHSPNALHLETLLTILNELALSHQQLMRLQGWLEAHAEDAGTTDLNGRLSEDGDPRLLRLVSQLNDNFVLITTRIQGFAVDDCGAPTDYMRGELRRVAKNVEAEVAAVRVMLAEAAAEAAATSQSLCSQDLYQESAMVLGDLLKVMKKCCKNVDLSV